MSAVQPSAPPAAPGDSAGSPTAALAEALAAARQADGGFAYYAQKRSRIEPTAWVALTRGRDAAGALRWLASTQGTDGWLRDDPRAPVNVGFNALALLALLTDERMHGPAGRVGAALVQVKGRAYGPSPVVRQDNSLQAWPWVDGTISWVEPTAYGLLALKRARHLGLLAADAAAAGTRIEVAEHMLEDRACASGGWNYGNARVFGQDLLAHGPTTALALLALQDRASAPFVQAGIRFLAARAEDERSGFALALTAMGLRQCGSPAGHLLAPIAAQMPVSLRIGNTVTLAALALVLSDAPDALDPLAVPEARRETRS